MGETGVRATAKALDQFASYVNRAFREFVNEQVDNTLKATLNREEPRVASNEDTKPPTAQEPEFTENEWQALYLVKSILMGVVASDRVLLNSVKGLGNSNIVLDNRLKPILRINFNKPEKLSVGFVTGDDKKGNFIDIAKVEDILHHSEVIRTMTNMYLAGKADKSIETSVTSAEVTTSEV